MENDEALYLDATNEFESEGRNPALWAKSMACCGGDELKAKYKYINDRVASLKIELSKKSEKELETEFEEEVESLYEKNIHTPDAIAVNFILNLSRGNYGLAKTYWLYGVLISVLTSILFSFMESKEVIVVCLLGISFYNFAVLVGTWRAAEKYNGFLGWALLAKVATIFGWFTLILTNIAIIKGG